MSSPCLCGRKWLMTWMSSYSSELESLWKLIAAKSLSSWVWKGCLEDTEIDEHEVICCRFTTWNQVERLQAFCLALPLFRNPLMSSRGIKRLGASTSSNLLFTSSETSRHAGAGQCLDRKGTDGEIQTSPVHLHPRKAVNDTTLWRYFGKGSIISLFHPIKGNLHEYNSHEVNFWYCDRVGL